MSRKYVDFVSCSAPVSAKLMSYHTWTASSHVSAKLRDPDVAAVKKRLVRGPSGLSEKTIAKRMEEALRAIEDLEGRILYNYDDETEW